MCSVIVSDWLIHLAVPAKLKVCFCHLTKES